ncbi:hypothetical protein AVEN_233576-1 [Araneus ventricosus]|uniref:Uncharacterized protein n=1 Tax=Araneus ventricosus TaxID=182803 RepID=A0A4Y2HPV3_ARAVE|nr:hypothetical protein AVEN_233576-1 [Araneus ventricosus]
MKATRCLKGCSWVLHDDNMPSDRYHLVLNYLPEHYIPALAQPANSPDFMRLFPRMNKLLKRQLFSSSEEVKRGSHWGMWEKEACNPHIHLCMNDDKIAQGSYFDCVADAYKSLTINQ